MSYTDGSRFSASLSRIVEVGDRESLDTVMRELAVGYGLKSAAYFGTGPSGRTNHNPFLSVTYSSDWVEHYKQRRFVEIDPVIQTGFRRLLPLDWDGFARTDERVKGISIPIHGRHGDRGLFSITSDFSDRDWDREKLLYLRDFQVLATHIHDRVLRLEGQRPKDLHLSPRELECLQWIAEGKTVWECATILGLSQHTVRCYLESTRHKLSASSNTHAVSIAHRAGLLLPPL